MKSFPKKFIPLCGLFFSFSALAAGVPEAVQGSWLLNPYKLVKKGAADKAQANKHRAMWTFDESTFTTTLTCLNSDLQVSLSSAVTFSENGKSFRILNAAHTSAKNLKDGETCETGIANSTISYELQGAQLVINAGSVEMRFDRVSK